MTRREAEQFLSRAGGFAALVLDANENGDRIEPAVVGIFISAYRELAEQVAGNQNFNLQFYNRRAFKPGKKKVEHGQTD